MKNIPAELVQPLIEDALRVAHEAKLGGETYADKLAASAERVKAYIDAKRLKRAGPGRPAFVWDGLADDRLGELVAAHHSPKEIADGEMLRVRRTLGPDAVPRPGTISGRITYLRKLGIIE